ncbi:unnamed protein product [Closterium sp. NIES-65]|nr:unnamed protein product [Closterium sp. NIES-65]
MVVGMPSRKQAPLDSSESGAETKAGRAGSSRSLASTSALDSFFDPLESSFSSSASIKEGSESSSSAAAAAAAAAAGQPTKAGRAGSSRSLGSTSALDSFDPLESSFSSSSSSSSVKDSSESGAETKAGRAGSSRSLASTSALDSFFDPLQSSLTTSHSTQQPKAGRAGSSRSLASTSALDSFFDPLESSFSSSSSSSSSGSVSKSGVALGAAAAAAAAAGAGGASGARSRAVENGYKGKRSTAGLVSVTGLAGFNAEETSQKHEQQEQERQRQAEEGVFATVLTSAADIIPVAVWIRSFRRHHCGRADETNSTGGGIVSSGTDASAVLSKDGSTGKHGKQKMRHGWGRRGEERSKKRGGGGGGGGGGMGGREEGKGAEGMGERRVMKGGRAGVDKDKCRRTLLLVSSKVAKEKWAPYDFESLFWSVRVVDLVSVQHPPARAARPLPPDFMILRLWQQVGSVNVAACLPLHLFSHHRPFTAAPCRCTLCPCPFSPCPFFPYPFPPCPFSPCPISPCLPSAPPTIRRTSHSLPTFIRSPSSGDPASNSSPTTAPSLLSLSPYPLSPCHPFPWLPYPSAPTPTNRSTSHSLPTFIPSPSSGAPACNSSPTTAPSFLLTSQPPCLPPVLPPPQYPQTDIPLIAYVHPLSLFWRSCLQLFTHRQPFAAASLSLPTPIPMLPTPCPPLPPKYQQVDIPLVAYVHPLSLFWRSCLQLFSHHSPFAAAPLSLPPDRFSTSTLLLAPSENLYQVRLF